jgi:hypothetical protein
MNGLEALLFGLWRREEMPERQELVAHEHPEKKSDAFEKPAPIAKKLHVWIISDYEAEGYDPR